ncbi:MAG: ABC transporter permease [Dehalococcoidia bacterium]
MLSYVSRRIALSVLVLWLVSLSVFVLLRAAPGDAALLQGAPASAVRYPADAGDGDEVRWSSVADYSRWVSRILRFDLGRSAIDGARVADSLRARSAVSLELMVLAVVWTCAIGIPLGVFSGLRAHTLPDYLANGAATLALGTPLFWLATMVLIVPQQWWAYAPPLDGPRSLLADPVTNLRQFIPASVVLALSSTAGVLRLTRASVLTVLHADYVRTAHAKGLRTFDVLTRHVLRIALPPVLASVGLLAAGLIGGSVVVESVFNLDGIGDYFFRSVMQKDFAVAQAIALYSAVGVVGINLVVDMIQIALDPRVGRG